MPTLHIVAGAVALLSGAAALIYRKGSMRHRQAGKVFFVSMLVMAGLGAYLAYFRPEMLSVLVGVLTCYLVATAWMTVQRKPNETGRFEVIALLVVLAVVAAGISFGFEAAGTEEGTKDGFPAEGYFFFSAIALLAAIFDVRVLIRRGVAGVQRVTRHLWRMCFAMWIAVTSLFLGQPQVFPEPISSMGFRATPVIVTIGLLLFWLIRVRFTPWSRKT